MAERIRPIEQMLELSEEEGMSPELLDTQVQKAQEQLLQLRRQADQIEKQKRELEELSRRQEELERGRAEMTDKLSRSLVIWSAKVTIAKRNSSKSGRRTKVSPNTCNCSKGSSPRAGTRRSYRRN